jgi:hypothetical protein
VKAQIHTSLHENERIPHPKGHNLNDDEEPDPKIQVPPSSFPWLDLENLGQLLTEKAR